MTSSSACEDRVLKDSTDLHIHVTPDSSPGWWPFQCLVLCGYTENCWMWGHSTLYSDLPFSQPPLRTKKLWLGEEGLQMLSHCSLYLLQVEVLHCLVCVSAVGCSAEAEALLAQPPFLPTVAGAVTALTGSGAVTQFLKHSWANVFNKQPFGGSIATFINCFPQMKHSEIEQLEFLSKYHLLINSFRRQDGLFGVPVIVVWWNSSKPCNSLSLPYQSCL